MRRETWCLAVERNAARAVNALEQPVEMWFYLFASYRPGREHAEVEIFGKAEGLQVALLEAGSALESPGRGENLV